MNFKHPHTKNTIILSDQTSRVAELDNSDPNDPHQLVTIGQMHSTQGILFIYKDEWPGFMDLVKQIDALWNSNLVELHQIKTPDSNSPEFEGIKK